jgi:crotonobetainyl-CoA:carnitine CoA-transferase CaiB-like acyl-CoA transferase
VQSIDDVLSDPQVEANGYISEITLDSGVTYRLPNVPVQLDGQPGAQRRAPEHGEDTELLLVELGYSWDDVAALKDAGIVL